MSREDIPRARRFSPFSPGWKTFSSSGKQPTKKQKCFRFLRDSAGPRKSSELRVAVPRSSLALFSLSSLSLFALSSRSLPFCRRPGFLYLSFPSRLLLVSISSLFSPFLPLCFRRFLSLLARSSHRSFRRTVLPLRRSSAFASEIARARFQAGEAACVGAKDAFFLREKCLTKVLLGRPSSRCFLAASGPDAASVSRHSNLLLEILFSVNREERWKT